MPPGSGQALRIPRGAKIAEGAATPGEYGKMSHLTEEQLVFHYYGEEGETLEAERHLDECEECRALYGSLQRLLNLVDSIPAPERGPEYGAEVWRRIEPRLPARRRWWMWVFAAPSPALRYAFAGAAMVVFLALAFLAGRSYPPRLATPPIVADAQNLERILLVAVGDYLDRSQMVLIELADRKSTRLNSSHANISYAVFCLKKKKHKLTI